jgi:acetylornithine aminotransferase
MCLAKALAGGLPIGACLSTPEAAVFAPGDHATTFGGGPVQSAAALATLEVIKAEGLVRRAHVAGARLVAMLSAAFPDAAVRGRGLLLALEFERDVAHDIVEGALGAGLVLNATSPTTLRICPPLVITDQELDHGFEILKEVTGAVLSTT